MVHYEPPIQQGMKLDATLESFSNKCYMERHNPFLPAIYSVYLCFPSVTANGSGGPCHVLLALQHTQSLTHRAASAQHCCRKLFLLRYNRYIGHWILMRILNDHWVIRKIGWNREGICYFFFCLFWFWCSPVFLLSILICLFLLKLFGQNAILIFIVLLSFYLGFLSISNEL